MLAGFAVKVEDLPAYMPHLKGSVETVNGASERMFVAGLPRYTKCSDAQPASRLAGHVASDPTLTGRPAQA